MRDCLMSLSVMYCPVCLSMLVSYFSSVDLPMFLLF